MRSLGVRGATPSDAIDGGTALLEGLADDARPTVCWWRVTASALVVSRGSRTKPNSEASASAATGVVQRSSGGGPVLWTPDLLALDIALPRNHSLWSPDIVESYRWIGALLASVFTDLGVAAHAVDPPSARSRNDPEAAARACFAGVSPWEVFHDERKLVGLAQIRRRHGVLLQIGIPLASQAPLVDLVDLAPSEREPLRELLARRTDAIDDLPAADVIVDAVSAALTAIDEYY